MPLGVESAYPTEGRNLAQGRGHREKLLILVSGAASLPGEKASYRDGHLRVSYPNILLCSAETAQHAVSGPVKGILAPVGEVAGRDTVRFQQHTLRGSIAAAIQATFAGFAEGDGMLSQEATPQVFHVLPLTIVGQISSSALEP